MGPPRLDAYERLIHRFYESMILLAILAPAQKSHVSIVEDPYGPQFVRRRFLRNLAFLSDFAKGGDSTPAIAVEDCRHAFNFWVGCNGKHAERIVTFLRAVLRLMREVSQNVADPGESRELVLFFMGIEFAAKRVRKEAKLLLKNVGLCLKHLEINNSQSCSELSQWLGQFQQPMDNGSLCQLAWQERHCDQISQLGSIHSVSIPEARQDGARNNFASVKHYIGRLAHHVRVSKQLIQDAPHLQRVFDSFNVFPVDAIRSVAQPTRDDQTTMQGVLRRMLPAGDERFPTLLETLSTMQSGTGIFDKFLGFYEENEIRPQVHAELLVLEHFFRHDLAYLDNDKYIGCSKAACLCCKLYIRYHPARCVEPGSHQKIYTNWSPPALPRGREDQNFIQQRKLLTQITHDIRADVLEQIHQRRISRANHADSMTDITGSMGVELEGFSD